MIKIFLVFSLLSSLSLIQPKIIAYIPEGTIIICENCHTKLYKCSKDINITASENLDANYFLIPIEKNIPKPIKGTQTNCPVCSSNLWFSFQSYIKTKELK